MARNLPPVVQSDYNFVPQKLFVDVSQTSLEVALEFEFYPHGKEYGSCIEDEPADTEAEQDETCESGEEKAEEYEKGQGNPADKDTFIAHVVEGESDVVYQEFHCLDVFFYGEL